MRSYIFRVTVEEDVLEDGRKAHHASCPALKGCHTWGHTYAEALANIREAVGPYIEDLRDSGEVIPGGVEHARPGGGAPPILAGG